MKKMQEKIGNHPNHPKNKRNQNDSVIFFYFNYIYRK